jgi:hypothetical protein
MRLHFLVTHAPAAPLSVLQASFGAFEPQPSVSGGGTSAKATDGTSRATANRSCVKRCFIQKEYAPIASIARVFQRRKLTTVLDGGGKGDEPIDLSPPRPRSLFCSHCSSRCSPLTAHRSPRVARPYHPAPRKLPKVSPLKLVHPGGGSAGLATSAARVRSRTPLLIQVPFENCTCSTIASVCKRQLARSVVPM